MKKIFLNFRIKEIGIAKLTAEGEIFRRSQQSLGEQIKR